MHTQLHNKNNFGFKPNRLANFQLGEFPVVGAVPGAVDGTKNLAKTWLGYGPTQTAIGVKKATWDLLDDVVYKNGIKNWGLVDGLTLGISKVGKMGAALFKNLIIDRERSAIHHVLQTGAGLASYTAGSLAQPAVGLVGGHHLKFDVPVAKLITDTYGRTSKAVANKLKSNSAQPAAATA